MTSAQAHATGGWRLSAGVDSREMSPAPSTEDLHSCRRRLTAGFFVWLVGLSLFIGAAVGAGLPGVVSSWVIPWDQPLEPSSESLDAFLENARARSELDVQLAPITIPSCVMLVGLVLYRLSLFRSVIAVSDAEVTISGLLSRTRRPIRDLAAVTSAPHRTFGLISEQLTFLRFDTGLSAVIRPAFVANAAELADHARRLVRRRAEEAERDLRSR